MSDESKSPEVEANTVTAARELPAALFAAQTQAEANAHAAVAAVQTEVDARRTGRAEAEARQATDAAAAARQANAAAAAAATITASAATTVAAAGPPSMPAAPGGMVPTADLATQQHTTPHCERTFITRRDENPCRNYHAQQFESVN